MDRSRRYSRRTANPHSSRRVGRNRTRARCRARERHRVRRRRVDERRKSAPRVDASAHSVFLKLSPERILIRMQSGARPRPMLGPRPTLDQVSVSLYEARLAHYERADHHRRHRPLERSRRSFDEHSWRGCTAPNKALWRRGKPSSTTIWAIRSSLPPMRDRPSVRLFASQNGAAAVVLVRRESRRRPAMRGRSLWATAPRRSLPFALGESAASDCRRSSACSRRRSQSGVERDDSRYRCRRRHRRATSSVSPLRDVHARHPIRAHRDLVALHGRRGHRRQDRR